MIRVCESLRLHDPPRVQRASAWRCGDSDSARSRAGPRGPAFKLRIVAICGAGPTPGPGRQTDSEIGAMIHPEMGAVGGASRAHPDSDLVQGGRLPGKGWDGSFPIPGIPSPGLSLLEPAG